MLKHLYKRVPPFLPYIRSTSLDPELLLLATLPCLFHLFQLNRLIRKC